MATPGSKGHDRGFLASVKEIIPHGLPEIVPIYVYFSGIINDSVHFPS